MDKCPSIIILGQTISDLLGQFFEHTNDLGPIYMYPDTLVNVCF